MKRDHLPDGCFATWKAAYGQCVSCAVRTPVTLYTVTGEVFKPFSKVGPGCYVCAHCFVAEEYRRYCAAGVVIKDQIDVYDKLTMIYLKEYLDADVTEDIPKKNILRHAILAIGGCAM